MTRTSAEIRAFKSDDDDVYRAVLRANHRASRAVKVHSKNIAKQLGVTPAGLRFLAKMVAHGTAPQTGNEAKPLLTDGLIAHNPESKGYVNFESVPYVITDAGREIVRRARQMGW